jgi:aspartate/methionine/tyrosine aminotransferase
MSQAILNNAKLCSAAAVMVTPILQDLEIITGLVELNIRRLRKAASIVVQFAELHGLTYYKPVAGLYIWLRLSKTCHSWDEEEALVGTCALEGALVGSGADYANSEPGWFRITFALPQERLLDGLRRIEDAVGYAEQFRLTRPSKFSFARCW